jgi:hypothetical protein
MLEQAEGVVSEGDTPSRSQFKHFNLPLSGGPEESTVESMMAPQDVRTLLQTISPSAKPS